MMQLFNFDIFAKHKYTGLLLTLLLLFIAYAIVGEQIEEIILSFILLSVIVLIVRTFYLRKRAFYFYLTIAGLGFVADCVYILFADSLHFPFLPALIASSIYICFFILSIILMTHKLFQYEEVTMDTIIGGICVFLLIGDLWFLFYAAIYLFDSEAFAYSQKIIRPFDLLYFSFTTLTTVGYGDILPVTRLAKIVANFEAIIGVIFPAVFISRLVGIYHPNTDNSDRE